MELLRHSGFDGGIQERVIKTSGDVRQDIKLSDFSRVQNGVPEKGVFTKELEDALIAGEIDAAIHSLKDLPAQLSDGFELVAVLPRAPVEDILLVKGNACSLNDLPEGATDNLQATPLRYSMLQDCYGTKLLSKAFACSHQLHSLLTC